jgi:hypothetical protein
MLKLELKKMRVKSVECPIEKPIVLFLKKLLGNCKSLKEFKISPKGSLRIVRIKIEIYSKDK